MSTPVTDRLYHLTMDGGSLMSNTDVEVLTAYGISRGWISSDGSEFGAGIRITDKPDYIRATFRAKDPDGKPVTDVRENEDLAWYDAMRTLDIPPQGGRTQLIAFGYSMERVQEESRTVTA
jgi:hypothetical protein